MRSTLLVSLAIVEGISVPLQFVAINKLAKHLQHLHLSRFWLEHGSSRIAELSNNRQCRTLVSDT
jgi:hypothetical protein